MKKVLLMLTVCSLSIASMHAGWLDWVRSIPAWKKEGTQEQKDALLSSAKQNAKYAGLATGSTALFLAATIATSPTLLGDIRMLEFNNDDAIYLLDPFNVVSYIRFSPNYYRYSYNFGIFSSCGLLASEIATLYFAAKAGYDWVQAQRIQINENV